jgi:hypothetical protein
LTGIETFRVSDLMGKIFGEEEERWIGSKTFRWEMEEIFS